VIRQKTFVAFVPTFVRIAAMNVKSITRSIARNVLKHVSNVLRNVAEWQLDYFRSACLVRLNKKIYTVHEDFFEQVIGYFFLFDAFVSLKI
jgi:hypothetical protein